MENKKGFYDEIYENYKNLSLSEVEELLLRCNEEEKESFIKMLEKCCIKRDLKEEVIKEENQEKEKIRRKIIIFCRKNGINGCWIYFFCIDWV